MSSLEKVHFKFQVSQKYTDNERSDNRICLLRAGNDVNWTRKEIRRRSKN